MTTNDAAAETPREAMADIVTRGLYTQTGSREALEDADNIIAHLWQAADDPEVVRELAGTIGGGGGGSMDAYSPGNVAAAYRAREILLTLLLGPRPIEQENGNGN